MNTETISLYRRPNKSDVCSVYDTSNDLWLEQDRKARGLARVRKSLGKFSFAIHLVTASAIVGGIAFEGARIVQAYSENQSDKDNASLSVDNFILANKEKLENIKFGCSFSPEMYGLDRSNYKTKLGQEQTKKMLSDLKFIVEDLKISNIRVGIRWNNVVDENNNNFSMDFYDPVFKYLLSQKQESSKNANQNMKVTAALGPKVPRWPEEHVPKNFEGELERIYNKGGVIYANTSFSDNALDYETKVLKDFQSKYSKEELDNLTTIQFNNEADNSFGTIPVRVDEKVQIQSVENAMKILPNKEYLFNSAGSLNIDQELKLLGDLRNKYPNLKLAIGIDNYDIDMGDQNISGVMKFNPLEVPFFGHVDNEFGDKITFDKFENAANASVQNNYRREITEKQAEAWDGKPQLPGNPVYNFQYGTLRSIRILNPDKAQTKNSDENSKFNISIWGIEKMAQNKDDSSNQQIFKLIRYVNSQSDEPTGKIVSLGTYSMGKELVTLFESNTLPQAA